MRYENVKFEFADFLLLKHPSYNRVSDRNEISVLKEFVNRGLFCVTEQERRPDGCISFERTEFGAQFYDRLLNAFEASFNREMENHRRQQADIARKTNIAVGALLENRFD